MLENPSPQVKKDTAWFLHRMARKDFNDGTTETTTVASDTVSEGEQVMIHVHDQMGKDRLSHTYPEGAVARMSFPLLDRSTFKPSAKVDDIVKTIKPGEKVRLQRLLAAMDDFPYLIAREPCRVYQGLLTHRYRRRNLDVGRMKQILQTYPNATEHCLQPFFKRNSMKLHSHLRLVQQRSGATCWVQCQVDRRGVVWGMKLV